MDLILKHLKDIVQTEEDVYEFQGTILKLAFTGNLTTKLDGDNVSDVLNMIKEHRKKLIESKLAKRIKSEHIKDEEKIFEIPNHWHWLRMSEISYDLGQKKPDKNFNYIDVASIDNQKHVISEDIQVLTPSEAPSRARKKLQSGAVIYSTVRPYLRNIAIIDREFEYEPIASTAFIVLCPFKGIYNKYLYYYLLSPLFTSYVQSQMIGVAYPAINNRQFYSGLFPLAPYKEQQEVISKIEDLFGICDQLLTEIRSKNDVSIKLNTAIFNRIQDSSNPKQKDDLAFAIQNMDSLCNNKDDVQLLRESLLSLALQGRLVKQEIIDDPTSVLLKKIEKEKKELINEKKIRRPRKLAKIRDEEKHYELPEGWEWVRLGRISKQIHYGHTASATTQDTGVKFLRITDIQNNMVDWKDVPYCDIDEKRLEALHLKERDILIARTGGTIGKSFLINNVDRKSVV